MKIDTSQLQTSNRLTLILIFLLVSACGAPSQQNSTSRHNHEALDQTKIGDPNPTQDDSDGTAQIPDDTDTSTEPTPTPQQTSDPVVDETVDLGQTPEEFSGSQSVETLAQEWARRAPKIIQFGVYGKAQGRDTFYIRLSKAVGTSGIVLPRSMITGATHGNETTSVDVLMRTIYQLAMQYAKDPVVTELINTRDTYFVPVVCPDGYDNNSREVEGQDPNRSFPGPETPQANSPQCISSIIKLFNDIKFNAVLDYHGYAGVVMYPWSYIDQPIETGDHDARHRRLSKEMADPMGYGYGQIPKIMYVAVGSSGDYWYWMGQQKGYRTTSLAIELATSNISQETTENYKPIQIFMREAPVLLTAYGDKYATGPLPPDQGFGVNQTAEFITEE